MPPAMQKLGMQPIASDATRAANKQCEAACRKDMQCNTCTSNQEPPWSCHPLCSPGPSAEAPRSHRQRTLHLGPAQTTNPRCQGNAQRTHQEKATSHGRDNQTEERKSDRGEGTRIRGTHGSPRAPWTTHPRTTRHTPPPRRTCCTQGCTQGCIQGCTQGCTQGCMHDGPWQGA